MAISALPARTPSEKSSVRESPHNAENEKFSIARKYAGGPACGALGKKPAQAYRAELLYGVEIAVSRAEKNRVSGDRGRRKHRAVGKHLLQADHDVVVKIVGKSCFVIRSPLVGG